MAVERDQVRQYVGITWDASELEGDEVEISATNPDSAADDLDLSTKTVDNSGSSFVTYDSGYHGKSDIVVSDGAGNEEVGQIHV